MPRDPLDFRALGERRPIPWDALDASHLDARQRAVVGMSWRSRYEQEHLAVGAFAIIARELAEEGCDPVVLALAARAAWDEVRHADICRRLAVALLGETDVPPRFRGTPRVPEHPDVTPSDRVLLHVVEMACLSETMTGVFFTEMAARTTDPAARVAVESLLEDEIDHGRLGWAYLAERARDGTHGVVVTALPAMLDRTVGSILAPAKRTKKRDDAALESLGYLGSLASAAVYARALEGVIFPGFEATRVDLGPARAHALARGWVS